MPNRKVLLVDDDPDLVEVLSELIAGLGYMVCGATTPEEAMEAVDKFEPEVALIDLRMPTMNGYDFAHIVREKFPLAYLVAFTGYKPHNTAIHMGDFDLYLLKPSGMTEIRKILQRAHHE